MHLKGRLAILFLAALLACGPSWAQASGTPGPLVDPNGGLNLEHPGAGKVMVILGRFGERLEAQVPGDDNPRNVRLVRANVRGLEREMRSSLLTLMSRADLGRFASWLTPLDGDPGEPAEFDPTNPTGTTIACLSAAHYLDEAGDKFQDAAQGYFLTFVGCPFSALPACNPPEAVFAFDAAAGYAYQAFDLIQQAADAYSGNQPCLAGTLSAIAAAYANLGQWATFLHYVSCGIFQASQQSQLKDCGFELSAGIALASAHDLAHLAKEKCWQCCGVP